MRRPTPESLMYEIIRVCEEIDRVASRLSDDNSSVFGELSLPMPKFTSAELGFLRTVSWLYVLYFEVGKVNVDFLRSRLSAYGFDPGQILDAHVETVQRLRTFLQHNLDSTNPHSRQVKQDCEQWFRGKCKSPVPEDESHWRSCLIGVLQEATEFLKALRKCIRSIEQDDSREQILRDWSFRRSRYHPPHEFDNLIGEVAADMGRDNLDAERLRKRFYDKWVKALDLLKGTYDFRMEARKLIEHVLLSESAPILPLTGDQIMQEFGIPPGPEVGLLLKHASILYNADPCPADVLIERLRQQFPNTGN